VTPEDAQDVVQLLQESLLDVFTTETGTIDTSRKGGISLAKQVSRTVPIFLSFLFFLKKLCMYGIVTCFPFFLFFVGESVGESHDAREHPTGQQYVHPRGHSSIVRDTGAGQGARRAY